MFPSLAASTNCWANSQMLSDLSGTWWHFLRCHYNDHQEQPYIFNRNSLILIINAISLASVPFAQLTYKHRSSGLLVCWSCLMWVLCMEGSSCWRGLNIGHYHHENQPINQKPMGCWPPYALENGLITVNSLILDAPDLKTLMFLISSWRYLCLIHWSQVLSWEWRCSWSSADRRCSNYIWVINNFLAY